MLSMMVYISLRKVSVHNVGWKHGRFGRTCVVNMMYCDTSERPVIAECTRQFYSDCELEQNAASKRELVRNKRADESNFCWNVRLPRDE